MRFFFTLLFVCSTYLMAQNYSSVADSSIKEMESSRLKDFHSRFSNELKEAITLSQLQSIWLSLSLQFGGLVKLHSYDSIADSKGMLFIIPMEFSKQWIDLRLHISEKDEIDGLFFAPGQKRYPYTNPSYADTSLFNEIAVKIPVKEEFLSGFITIPRLISNKIPVVILVHGSGPNDMDESIGPNKIFKDIAWGLATNGIAVLRYNKITKELPHLLNPTSVTIKEEVTDDVSSAIALIKTLNLHLDTQQIYILGHSLGGMLAPLIATENTVKGIILAGANSRPLQDLIVEQVAYLNQLDGNFTDYEKREWAETKEKAKVISKRKFDKNTPPSQLLMGLSGEYWTSLNNYSQNKVATKLPESLRILILQGERDYQVSFEKDFGLWKQVLKKRKNVEFISYPSLNHIFTPGEGLSSPQEYDVYHPFFEPTLMDIVKWIKN